MRLHVREEARSSSRASFFISAPELPQSWRILSLTLPLPAPGAGQKGRLTHTRRPFLLEGSPRSPSGAPQKTPRGSGSSTVMSGDLAARAKARARVTNAIASTATDGDALAPPAPRDRRNNSGTTPFDRPSPGSRGAPRRGWRLAKLRVAASAI